MKSIPDSNSRDEAWLEALFRQHHVKIRAFVMRRSQNEADDIVSLVFETAWRNRYRVPEEALPWLYRTASHHLLHEFRSRSRRKNREDLAESHALTDFDNDSAESIANNLDQVRVVQLALAQLSDIDAELLRLWAWEQLEISEIAEVLGCSSATARVRLHRARKRCAALLPEARKPLRALPKLVEEKL